MFFRSAGKRRNVIVCCDSLKPGSSESLGLEMCELARQIASKFKLNVVVAAADNNHEFVRKCGAEKIYVAKPANDGYQPEWYLAYLETVFSLCHPQVVLFPHTNWGLDIAPRLSQRLDGGLVTDVRDVRIEKKQLHAIKPIEGGVALATYNIHKSPQVLTVPPGIRSTYQQNANKQTEIINLDVPFQTNRSHWKQIRHNQNSSDEKDLNNTEIVVGGGRGIGGKDGFLLLGQFAEILNGTVGASRPPCDANWIQSSRQIGITGKSINPKLYIPIGISGTFQHLAGINGCDMILAINNDPKAYIFEVSDYGVVGDYKSILSALIKDLDHQSS